MTQPNEKLYEAPKDDQPYYVAWKEALETCKRQRDALLEACKFLLKQCRNEGLDVIEGPNESEFMAAGKAIAAVEKEST